MDQINEDGIGGGDLGRSLGKLGKGEMLDYSVLPGRFAKA
jgi:hypothetical protein